VVAVGGVIPLFALALAFRAGPAPAEPTDLSAYYPDLQTVVPTHLNLVKEHQRDLLRFSNGIANSGPGPWGLRPEHELGQNPTTTAFQQIRSNNAKYECGTQPKQVTACYQLLAEYPASIFEYHPDHHHWHTAQVAQFEVLQGSPTGPVVSGNSVKVGFCLVEVYRLEGKAGTSERTFWDCFGSFQGVGAGWVDQYHQATPGQELDLTDVADGEDYYLVSTTDPDNAFLETDDTNNTAWVSFELSTHSNGRRKVTVTGHSDCASPGLCGVGAPNRG
jgi:hypothetical protein